jgi:hypothetical protein
VKSSKDSLLFTYVLKIYLINVKNINKTELRPIPEYSNALGIVNAPDPTK